MIKPFFVDAGMRYEGDPTLVVTGLWHLEGESVAVLANGVSVGPLTVLNGSITLATPASEIVVGLPIDAAIQTLPVAFQADAYGLGLMKNVNSLLLRVSGSNSFMAGPDLANLREYTVGVDPITEVVELVIDPDWNYDASVYVVQPYPLPLTVLAVALDGAP